MNKKKILTPLYLTISILWRLIPHWPNLTPFTALALYTGAQNRSLSGLLLPLVPLALTDLYFGLHGTILFVYLSMSLITLLGQKFNNRSPLTLAICSISGSSLFFVVTNLGVWLTSGLYPLTLSGLITAYTLALPFFQNAIIGDLLFTLVFFGCAGIMEYWGSKKLARAEIKK